MVIGYHYMDMIRYYGAMPWIDHAYSAEEIFKFPRLTLEETVEKQLVYWMRRQRIYLGSLLMRSMDI